jgi:amidohydrolase
MTRMRIASVAAGAVIMLAGHPGTAAAQTARTSLQADVDRLAAALQPKLVEWRRDFHQHPELSNREVRTSKIVASHLRALGLEVRTGVATHGVVGVLKGARPGPVVALRADMDALPVTEEGDLPFKSTVRTTFNGQDVGVMHACGHDLHMSILMGTASVLAAMRDRLSGTIVFIFQPAEEGVPAGEVGGAPQMIAEGALDSPKVEAIFGLHVFSTAHLGDILVRPGGLMAASDTFQITVRGRQTHGAMPWQGVDPIVVASQIVLGLQTIVSRQLEITKAPAVVSVGQIQGGTRFNIVPDSVRLEGTIRTFDPAMQDVVHARIRRTAEQIAAGAGATSEVEITKGNPVTWNDPALVERMAPSLQRVATGRFNATADATTTAEDFAFYQQRIPGMYFFLGVTPLDVDLSTVAANHSPRFYADEGALVTGVRALASLAVDYLAGGAKVPGGAAGR